MQSGGAATAFALTFGRRDGEITRMIMETSSAQCRHLLSLAEPMLDGLGDEHLNLAPPAFGKTAGWLLGHLCITADFARKLCGRRAICPAEWRATFSPGTTPPEDAAAYPQMSALCDAFRRTYQDLCDAALAADDAMLSVPTPFERARPAFPTVREFLPWLMTGHLAYHLGQLGDWRRVAGLGHKGNI
jgi:hypothetical protein